MTFKSPEQKIAELEERIEHLENVLKQIADMAHDASGTCAEAFKEVYWDIRNLAYEEY